MERPLRALPPGRPALTARGSLRLPSHAKVNLGLEVLGLRRDGYHELRTIFQTVSLHDDVLLSIRKAGLRVRCERPGVPSDETNLAARAAIELARLARRRPAVAIEIVKRIPVAGGLGGGSSNAAAVLLGLDRLWRLGLGPAGLEPLARRIGADVPFFLTGGTALGLARGDEVYPLATQVRAHVVIAAPDRPLSTAAVFRRLDARLTSRENSHTIYRFVSRDLEGDGGYSLLSNDLEKAALEEAPELAAEVRRIRSVLVRAGARLASLSGSGSAMFGLFDTARDARRARRALLEAGVVAFCGRTLSRDQYRRVWARALRP